MLEELKAYYVREGIAPTSFRCEQLTNCKGDCDTFYTGQEALVGSGYGNAGLPRILFISLDAGSTTEDPETRTTEAFRQWAEHGLDFEGLNKSRHWYLTHELAWTFLRRFKTDLEIDEVRTLFAHTNSAKCCMMKDGRSKADVRLFTNCSQYIPGEIKVLRPDIIVTQGKEAREAVQREYTDSIDSVEDCAEGCEYWNVKYEGGEALLFHTYHPRAYGQFWGQRAQCFEYWADVAHAHLEGNNDLGLL